jgi:GNAT superfamily N-acetyltransferase
MAAIPDSRSSESPLQIRLASDDDVTALTQLINAAFVVEQIVFDGNRVDDLAVRTYMGSGTFLLAEDSTGLLGCVYVETHGHRSYLGLLAVQPARQGLGLGKLLVAAAEKLARESGSRIMDLRVISPRAEQLLPFYQRLGYGFVRTEPFPADLVTKLPSHYILLSKPIA